jgi:peptide-methionine (S)-S-oxide reductase
MQSLSSAKGAVFPRRHTREELRGTRAARGARFARVPQKITFDAQKISYGQILKVFFDVAHDPTQLNHQGPDVGTQYRSAIFYTTPEQKRIAEAYIKQLDDARVFRAPIVTQVVVLNQFYPAEEHHQNFCNRNPHNPYVMSVAQPKIDKVKQKVPELAKQP